MVESLGFFIVIVSFLPLNFPYRAQKDKFKKNTIVHDLPPPWLSSEEIFRRVLKLSPTTFGKIGDKGKKIQLRQRT